jgi:diguanylate cyclase (GGDEF)-like protein
MPRLKYAVLVSENKAVIKTVSKGLKESGFEPVSFNNPEEAAEYPNRKNVSLLLIDISIDDPALFILLKSYNMIAPDLICTAVAGAFDDKLLKKLMRYGVRETATLPLSKKSLKSFIDRINSQTGDKASNITRLDDSDKLRTILKQVRISLSEPLNTLMTDKMNSICQEIISLRHTKDDMQRALSDMRAVQELSDAMTTLHNLHEILILMINLVESLIPSEASALYLYDESIDSFQLNASKELDDDKKNEIKSLIDGGIFKWAIEQGKPVILPREDGPGVYVISPLIMINRPLGVMVLVAKRAEDSIRQQEMELVNFLSKQGSLAVENARLTTIDPLTGLYNRRAMQSEFERQFKAVRRYSRPLSIIMMDIDNFKNYNDNNGHQAGDRLLSTMGSILLKGVREVDIAARYGGEEFLLILPETPLVGATIVAKRLEREIAETEFKFADKQPLGFISVSQGVATFMPGTENPAQLIKSADVALYAAKDAGRNTIKIQVPAGTISISDLLSPNITESV